MIPGTQKIAYVLLIPSLLLLSCNDYKQKNKELLIENLQCEYTINPIGIDTTDPRLGWQTTSTHRNKSQSAYQVLIASSPDKLNKNKGDILNTGKVPSNEQSGLTFGTLPLKSSTRYYWKVRIWDESGKASKYSEMAFFETGILDPADWRAQWITSSTVYDWNRYYLQLANHMKSRQKITYTPEIILSKTFDIDRAVKDARIHISGLGFYRLGINGEVITGSGLNPAFTQYHKTVLYNSYNVAHQIKTGSNRIEVGLGNGFYNEEVVVDWAYDKAPWRARPKLLFQLYIQFENGKDTLIISDASWQSAPSQVIRNSTYGGELHDYSIDYTVHIRDNIRSNALPAPAPTGRLVAQVMPLEEIIHTFQPRSITKLTRGSLLIDAGVNLSGRLKILLNGEYGDTVLIRYAELLHKDGTADQSNINRNTLDNIQTDVIILPDTGTISWLPKYEYHGFQYAELIGYKGKLLPEDVEVQLIHTDFNKKGNFNCSDSLINQLQAATLQSFVSNYHGYPTDCPQREKNGWTADAHLSARTGLYNFDMTGSFEKWMNDFEDALLSDGRLPGIVPTSGWGYQIYLNITDPIGPAWDAAYILIPWYTYVHTGNTLILHDHYEGMKKHISFIASRSPDHIVKYGLSDWAFYKTQTNWEVTSSCYYAIMVKTLAKIAGVLGEPDDESHYRQLYENIKTAFNKKFFDPVELNYANGSQAARAGAVYCGFTDSLTSITIIDELEKEITGNGYHLDCGILGAEFILKTFAEFKREETIYKVISNREFPGWGYWIEQGSTTLWESWDGHDSRNHIMFGHISEWFYKHLAGIQPKENFPGFKQVIIAPAYPEGLEWVSAQISSPYGKISSEWRRDDNHIQLNITVPFNTTAEVLLPGDTESIILSDDLTLQESREKINISSGSGNYVVEFNLPE